MDTSYPNINIKYEEKLGKSLAIQIRNLVKQKRSANHWYCFSNIYYNGLHCYSFIFSAACRIDSEVAQSLHDVLPMIVFLTLYDPGGGGGGAFIALLYVGDFYRKIVWHRVVNIFLIGGQDLAVKWSSKYIVGVNFRIFCEFDMVFEIVDSYFYD